MSTDQVTPPSEVANPDEVTSYKERVSPKDESAESSTIVVERYSATGSWSANFRGGWGAH